MVKKDQKLLKREEEIAKLYVELTLNKEYQVKMINGKIYERIQR